MTEGTIEDHEQVPVHKGTIVIFYKDTPGGRVYLTIKNKGTGSISFVGGGMDDSDESLASAAQREVSEEVGIEPHSYSLTELDGVAHEFTYGAQKKERAGQKAVNQVFVANLTESEIGAKQTSETTRAPQWLTEAEVLEQLTFPDVKEVFLKAIATLE